jgi:multiple sugar transport system substrate-binding protein
LRRIALAAALLVAVLAGGCAPRAPRAPRPPKLTEVVFWQAWPAGTVAPIVSRFETENPGVHVSVVTLSPASLGDSITGALAAGHPPDLCEIGSAAMPGYLAAGTLSDWSAGVADLRDSLRGWPMCMVGDAIYGLPWQLGTRALFYNRTLFARAGLSASRVPQTWEQLDAAAARIQRLGHGVHGFGVPAPGAGNLFAGFMPFAWGNGGELLSAGSDSSRFDSPENVKALEFYQRLRRSAFVGTQDSLEREFAAGRLGLLLSGTAFLAALPKPSPALDFGVALVPRPAAGRGENASIASGSVLVSFNASKRKEIALRLARFLARPENALALAVATQRAEPATVGADSMAWYAQHPDRQVLVRQLATARYAPGIAAWDSMGIAIEEQVGLALEGRKSAFRAVADADARLAELSARKGR